MCAVGWVVFCESRDLRSGRDVEGSLSVLYFLCDASVLVLCYWWPNYRDMTFDISNLVCWCFVPSVASYGFRFRAENVPRKLSRDRCLEALLLLAPYTILMYIQIHISTVPLHQYK